ncbi:uncharacterized protein LOC142239531 [Haematobia irritans]|uniref:uncharacterized protein LOC142239531 n=1 Tax=Haematobia irritans TaxID=7368 RepID=UPI003F50D23F
MTKNQLLISLILLNLFALQNFIKVQLTDMVCTTIDKTFSHFNHCLLEPDGSGKSLSLEVNIKKLPLTNLFMQMEFSRLEMRTTVAILNNTWDVCKFLNSINKYRALRIFYDIMKDYSNINHSCPYTHDIRVVKFSPKVDSFPIPLPAGKYKLKNTYIVDAKNRLSVALIFVIKN